MVFVLNYFEKGEKKIKNIEIEFVPQRFLKNYKKLQNKVKDFAELINTYQDNLVKRTNLLKNKNIDVLEPLYK